MYERSICNSFGFQICNNLGFDHENAYQSSHLGVSFIEKTLSVITGEFSEDILRNYLRKCFLKLHSSFPSVFNSFFLLITYTEHGFTVPQISLMTKVSVGKIKYLMRKLNIRSKNFANISVQELDTIVSSVVETFPNAGKQCYALSC